MKYDIKEYYLSGGHTELAEAAASLIEEKSLANWGRDAALFVLSSQLFNWSAEDGVHFKVLLGLPRVRKPSLRSVSP